MNVGAANETGRASAGRDVGLTDTHAHLDDPKFAQDLPQVLARAGADGVGTILTVACWRPEAGFGNALSLFDAARDAGVRLFCALGVHPHDVSKASAFPGRDPMELIRHMALDNPRVVAIGETGLDFHYMHSSAELQAVYFRRHIALARELNLPLIVHSREADDETMAILEDEGVSGGVLHCFSGDARMARRAMALGMYLSISGVATFKTAEGLHEIIRNTPIERLLLETDCPYLSPVPERGRRNEPAFLVHTARKVAELKGLSLGDVARITTLNATELFAMGGRAADAMIAYPIRNSLYLNITNRCSNHCSFCAKFRSYTVKGHYLRLSDEPGYEEVMRAIGPEPQSRFDEIVFCGFGEPLIRLDLVRAVGMALKKMGCRIRIDTDGLANLYHGRNVLPELGFVDTISVSLNAPDSASYRSIIKTPYGDGAYPAILYFLREAKKHIAKVVATAVSVPGIDMEATRRVAEDELGVPFRVRVHNEVG